jgi:hypothetical protein
MAQYVSFDPTLPSPQPILGWYDTALTPYPNLPPSAPTLPAGFIAVTTPQWSQHIGDLAKTSWSIVGGVLTYAPVPPPAPTPAQVADATYAAFIAAGLTVTSTGTPALSGVYAIDADSQVTITTEANFVGAFQEFTNQQTTDLQWPLPNGSTAVFPTMAAFMAFAKQTGQVVAAAKLAASLMAAGQTASMPSASVVIP